MQTGIAKIDIRLTDIQDDMRRMPQDISLLRGESGAVRHDLNRLSERYVDLEVRVCSLEKAEQ
jgi:hypothetical protein